MVQRPCQLSGSQFAPPRFFADRKHAYSFAPAVAKKSGGDCVRFSVSAKHQALSLLTPAFFCGGAKRNFLDSVVTPAAKPKACILYRLRGTFKSMKNRETVISHAFTCFHTKTGDAANDKAILYRWRGSVCHNHGLEHKITGNAPNGAARV